MRANILILAAALAVVAIFNGACKGSSGKTKPPEITSLSQSAGREGDVIIITGKRFSKKTSKNLVTFNGFPATILLSKKDPAGDQLTVLVPFGATTGPVKVVKKNKGSNEVPFTVLTPPTITALIPNFGPEGAVITVQGRYFDPTPQNNIVRFAGQLTATITAVPNMLTVFVPPGAVTGDVTVENTPDVSNGFPFTVTTPMLTQVQEFFGPVDGTIVLSGQNFSPTASENIVRFAGVESTVIFASTFGDSLSTIVPMGARAGPLTVEVTGGRGTSNGMPFCLDGSSPAPPTITMVSPGSGTSTTPVTIDGSGYLMNNPNDNEVRFNGTLAQILSATDVRIQTEVPIGAVGGPVTVTVAGQTITGPFFTVTNPVPPPPPTVTALEPIGGFEGDWVFVRGTDFSPEPTNNQVYFNGVQAEIIGSAAEGILVYAPFSSTGDVTVTTGGQASPAGIPFIYLGAQATSGTFDYFGQTLPAKNDSVIFVLDISGTNAWIYGNFTDRFGMPVTNGTRLDLIIDRTADAINNLPSNFIFNVIAYDCGPLPMSPTAFPADPGFKAAAITWVEALFPSGSSDTGRAGVAALNLDPGNRTIVLVSDGSPTCGPTSQASHLCEILTVNDGTADFHTFSVEGFGDFVTFMQDLASLTGGVYNIAQ